MEPTGAVFIRGPELRKRWGAMPCSTFYERLKRGVIPKPEYPFGPDTPYWRIEEIEAHERKAVASK
jgi:predicted DNA-binding transcriptional regulator AlpA